MPAPTRVGIYDGNYYSLSTGLPLKSSPFKKKDGSLKANYLQPVAVTMGELEKIQAMAKAKRNTYAKERSAGYAENRRATYRNNLLAYHPDVYNNLTPYASGKKMGQPRRVGSSKDSYLTAVNNTVATITGIPLNKHNRAIIGKIYSEEIADQASQVSKFFRGHQGEFDKAKNIRLRKTAAMAPERIKKEAAREAWAERYSYGGKSAPALTRKAMMYGDISLPDVENKYRYRR